MKNSTVYQEKGLHNYIISCHRKHSGQHNRCDTRVAHDGKVGCHTVECTIAFLCKYVYHFLTNDTETFTRRNKVTLVSKWVVRFFFKRWRIVWRHRFKPAFCIPLDSDFSLISSRLCPSRLCRARFIPLWKRNALWELVNETIPHLWFRVDFGLYSIG